MTNIVPVTTQQVAYDRYGRDKDLTKAMKAALNQKEITYNGKKWVVVNEMDPQVAKATRTHFYDRILHVLKKIFSSEYRQKFSQAATKLSDAITRWQTQERNLFNPMYSFATKLSPADIIRINTEKLADNLKKIDVYQKEKDALWKQKQDILGRYDDPSFIQTNTDKMRKGILGTLTSNELARRQELEETEIPSAKTEVKQARGRLDTSREALKRVRETPSTQRSNIRVVGAIAQTLSQEVRKGKAAELKAENEVKQGLDALRVAQDKLDALQIEYDTLSVKLPDNYRELTTTAINQQLESKSKGLEMLNEELAANPQYVDVDAKYKEILTKLDTIMDENRVLREEINVAQGNLPYFQHQVANVAFDEYVSRTFETNPAEEKNTIISLIEEEIPTRSLKPVDKGQTGILDQGALKLQEINLSVGGKKVVLNPDIEINRRFVKYLLDPSANKSDFVAWVSITEDPNEAPQIQPPEIVIPGLLRKAEGDFTRKLKGLLAPEQETEEFLRAVSRALGGIETDGPPQDLTLVQSYGAATDKLKGLDSDVVGKLKPSDDDNVNLAFIKMLFDPNSTSETVKAWLTQVDENFVIQGPPA